MIIYPLLNTAPVEGLKAAAGARACTYIYIYRLYYTILYYNKFCTDCTCSRAAPWRGLSACAAPAPGPGAVLYRV